MINNITYYGEIPESFYSFADGLSDLQKAEIRESFVMTVQVSRRYCVFYARDFYFLIYASGEIELMRPGFTKVSVADLLAQGQETFRVCARPGTVDVSLSYLDILEVQSNFDSQLILDNLVLVLDELKKKLASLVNGKAPTVHTHSYSALPVDNSDASMPSVGIGGFSYAVSSTGATGAYPSITIGSGGTWVYVANSMKSGSNVIIPRVGRLAGGSSVQGLTRADGDTAYVHVIAWRIA